MNTTPHATALADQIGAASLDAQRFLHDAARRDPGARCYLAAGTGWLAEQAATLAADVLAGRARVCSHIGAAPRVVHAAVWAPRLLVCPDCIRMLTPTEDEDSTCDRCRRRSEHIRAAIAAFGPVLLAYGLCADCTHATGLDSGKDTRP